MTSEEALKAITERLDLRPGDLSKPASIATVLLIMDVLGLFDEAKSAVAEGSAKSAVAGDESR